MKTIKIVLISLIVICVFGLIGVGGYLFVYYRNLIKADIQYADLKEYIKSSDMAEETGGKDMPLLTYEDVDGISVLEKYVELYKKNNDFVGWLTIPGTHIDYPVMYSRDEPEYYLHKDFYKEHSYAGCLFADVNSNPLDSQINNVLIYGHNMKGGTMFHDLLKYADEEFYKDHKVIKFDTIDEVAEYEIVGAFYTQIYPVDDTKHFHYYEYFRGNKEDYDQYISFVKRSTNYNTTADPVYGDKLITLSTCAYHTANGRFVVVAKKI